MAYKRRFTDSESGVDSFALVTVSGSATFKNILNGKYVDAITGEIINIENIKISLVYTYFDVFYYYKLYFLLVLKVAIYNGYLY